MNTKKGNKKIILPVSADVPIEITKALPIAPTTTEQEDMIVAGQRRINLVWETTQAFTTSIITVAAIYCAINKIESDIINFAFIAIISTYYTRTNHTKTGGVSPGQTGR